jgi:hypothetical protein
MWDWTTVTFCKFLQLSKKIAVSSDLSSKIVIPAALTIVMFEREVLG